VHHRRARRIRTAYRFIYAGVDYEEILRQAEHDGDVVLWDGGNNDTSFYRPDLDIVVLDPHRPGHELGYYPGEVNFRAAKVLIINKVDTANPASVQVVREHIAQHNPKAQVIEMACRVTAANPEVIKGKRVLVVEDGPTLTHGEMPYGAGYVAATSYGAAEMVDPRPYAVGSIKKTFEKFPHLSKVLPAMGYSEIQRHELEETIKQVPCDVVLVATPIDLVRTMNLHHPSVRISYEVEEIVSPCSAACWRNSPPNMNQRSPWRGGNRAAERFLVTSGFFSSRHSSFTASCLCD
jgi:predicted GTPase